MMNSAMPLSDADLALLRHCFYAALEVPETQPVDQLEYAKDPVWDSVAHMRLIARIEQDFNVMFTTEQILDLSSFVKAGGLIMQARGATL
jgi:acyl carrier protein